MDSLDAWLTIIADRGWAQARLGDVATAAGIDAGVLADTLPDRWSALRAYGHRLDRAALAAVNTDAMASVRDRLFTMIMERFDAAQAHRAAATELARAARRDPGLAAFFATTIPQSVGRLADAAGVDVVGVFGPLRVQALTLLYARVAQAWLADDSADLAATMKTLDSQLAQAERLARFTPHAAAPVIAAEVPRSSDDPPPV